MIARARDLWAEPTLRRGATRCDVLLITTLSVVVALAFCLTATRHVEKERIRACTFKLRRVSAMCHVYSDQQMPAEVPRMLTDLTHPPGGEEPYLNEEDLVDPWGARLLYRRLDEKSFRVFSAGPDGVEGSEDDVN